ncbi:MAG: phosphoenolpyruvate synthase [Candidatus Aenigmatarchaeota archaeon]
MPQYVVDFEEVDNSDVSRVGGKNASLGEMLSKVDVPVPPGFAITSEGYDFYLEEAGIKDEIRTIMEASDLDDVKQLRKAGSEVRKLIEEAEIPKKIREELKNKYRELGEDDPRVAVRSSATAEDLPTASFAGQQDTYLNVADEDELYEAMKKCIASLFTDRAIHYREEKGFDHFKVKLSVGVQKMVDSLASGIMFTIEPNSGFEDVIHIDGSWGLGEMVVGGKVNPDQYLYFKPTGEMISREKGKKAKELIHKDEGNKEVEVEEKRRNEFVLTEEEVEELASYGVEIEKHYGRPMDIEWAKDRRNDKLYILQARPETVHSQKEKDVIKYYNLQDEGQVLCSGQAIGRKISQGEVNIIIDKEEMHQFKEGQVLVTDMTDPDWEPIMKKSAAVITEKGGATSHAAIVSRELGIPAIVGTENATSVLKDQDMVTVDCSGGKGKVLKGDVDFEVVEKELDKIPETETKVMMNVGVPENALDLGQYPVQGVGLARQEFIIGSSIGKHPMKMIEDGEEGEFIEKLSYGVAKIAAGFYPKPVIVRLSDFKSNEYASLEGGEEFEPVEENPMLGWRGASRYVSEEYREAFALECEALKRVRNEMGLTNVKIMVPFCRTLEEAEETIDMLKDKGLERRENGLEIYMMTEIPSNVILAEEFAELFDGFSIGSNDLTQLTLGVDRDNKDLQHIFDERNLAVKRSIRTLIEKAHKKGNEVSICGNAPSVYPDYAAFLVENGIDEISVTPDMVLQTILHVKQAEKELE